MEIKDCKIYGLQESMVASGFPMRTETTMLLNPSDIERAKKLGNVSIGSGHDNFLNGIIVQFTIEWPVKLWTEAQRYHFLDFVSSCSTMHKLCRMDLKKAFDKNVDYLIVARMIELQNEYNNNKTEENFLKMIMSCPVGLDLAARMTTNYRQLKTIYAQRKNHRLPQWREFCKWIESLDYVKELGVI